MVLVKRRQRLLSGVAGAAVVVMSGLNAPASAQGVLTWTGFYVGANAGAAWGRSKVNSAVNCNVPPLGPAGANYICDTSGAGADDAAALNASGSGNVNKSGFTGGVQVGYNWQQNNFLYGIETDFGAFNVSGSKQGAGVYPGAGASGVLAGVPYTMSTSASADWLYTLRGRIGWLVQPNLLAYATGGLAVTRLQVGFNYSDTLLASGSGSASETKAGWAIGGGLEWAFNKHWSIKGEYLYVDFGSVTATGTIATGGGGYSQGISTSADLAASIVRLGVNYKF